MVLIRILANIYIGVVKTFLGIVFLDHGLGVVQYIGGQLTSGTQPHLHLDIFFLAFLHALIYHLRSAGTLLEGYLQPYLVAFDLVGKDLHIREQALFPEALDRFGDLVAGHLDLVSHSQARETDQHKIFITVCTAHLDIGYRIGVPLQRIFNLGQRCRVHRCRIFDLLRPSTRRQGCKTYYIE